MQARNTAKAKQIQTLMLLRFQQPQIFAVEISILDNPFFVGWMMNREMHIDDMCTEGKIYELKIDRNKKHFHWLFSPERDIWTENRFIIFAFVDFFCWFLATKHYQKSIVNGYKLFGVVEKKWARSSTNRFTHVVPLKRAITLMDWNFCRENNKRQALDFLLKFQNPYFEAQIC